MTIYISGPMKGFPDGNRSAFLDAEAIMRERGYEVVNPIHLSPARKPDESDEDYYERCIQIDLEALERCDGIFLLPAWQASSGAIREYKRATELGIEVLHG